MKRLLSVFLCVGLLFSLFSGLAAFADDRMLGDVDGDGAITTSDARLVLQLYSRKIHRLPVGEGDFSNFETTADVDRDGALTTTDARLILQYYAGKITEWPNPFTIVGLGEKGQILSVEDTADGPAISGHVLHQLCVYEHGKPTKQAVTWVSADPGGITIDADGYLTHYEFGKQVLVTATLENGETVSLLVYTHGPGLVFEPPYMAVVTGSEHTACKDVLDVTLADGDTVQLQLFDWYTKTPYTGEVTWRSTKEEIASVDENGKVTLHAAGSTRIYAKISEKDQLEVHLRIS